MLAWLGSAPCSGGRPRHTVRTCASSAVRRLQGRDVETAMSRDERYGVPGRRSIPMRKRVCTRTKGGVLPARVESCVQYERGRGRLDVSPWREPRRGARPGAAQAQALLQRTGWTLNVWAPGLGKGRRGARPPRARGLPPSRPTASCCGVCRAKPPPRASRFRRCGLAGITAATVARAPGRCFRGEG